MQSIVSSSTTTSIAVSSTSLQSRALPLQVYMENKGKKNNAGGNTNITRSLAKAIHRHSALLFIKKTKTRFPFHTILLSRNDS